MAHLKNEVELRSKLTQMFLSGIPGKEIIKDVQEFLKEYRPGGIIYYARNYETPALLGEFSNRLQDFIKNLNSLPLFICIKQEGGESQFLSSPFTQFPNAKELGKLCSSQLAFQIAKAMAEELKAVGINLNFWPMCDIHTKKNNPMMKRRAFGNTEELVSKISSSVVRGFVKTGMVSCVKHFPGHGDTNISSDMGLPKINTTWEQLLGREIKPFRKAFQSGAHMCIVGHILNSAIDELYPSSISFMLLTKHLREELRYRGLIACDDMQLRSISENFKPQSAVSTAINAGVDILIYHNMRKAQEGMDAAWKCVKDGSIAEERINESYKKIQAVKEKVLGNFPAVDIDKFSEVVGCEAHKKLLEQLYNPS